MKERKIYHLYNPGTGKTLCGIPVTENVEAGHLTSRMTCKRCERITSSAIAKDCVKKFEEENPSPYKDLRPHRTTH